MFRVLNTFRLTTTSQQIRLVTKNLSNLSELKPNCASSMASNTMCRIKGIKVNLKNCFMQHGAVRVEFHTSPCRRALPPILFLLVKPFGKATAMVFGRTVKRWWMKLTPEQRIAFLQSVETHKWKIYASLTLIPVGFLIYYNAHLQIDPITGRKKFIVYSKEQIIQMAQLELDMQIERHKANFLLPSHPSFKRVTAVTNRLLRSNNDLSQIQDHKWLVTVVDEPRMLNAFVLPTGHIFIFTGMLNECLNDDQLCIILAHEVSHVLLNHPAEQLSNLNFLDMMLMVPIALVWAILPDVAALFTQWLSHYISNLMFRLPFSRSLEMEADQVGLLLTAKACYDVREASAFWAKMSLQEDPDQVELLSTHPNSDSRSAKLDELMPSAIKLREECKCPRLPLVDPRSFIPKKHNLPPGIRGG